jgi:hypothetical protein
MNRIFIFIFVSFAYSKNIMNMPSVQIANKIGNLISHQNYESKISINTKQIDYKLKTIIQDPGFKFKSAIVDWYVK